MRSAHEASQDNLEVEEERLRSRLAKRAARATNTSDTSRGFRKRHAGAHVGCCAFPFGERKRDSLRQRTFKKFFLKKQAAAEKERLAKEQEKVKSKKATLGTTLGKAIKAMLPGRRG